MAARVLPRGATLRAKAMVARGAEHRDRGRAGCVGVELAVCIGVSDEESCRGGGDTAGQRWNRLAQVRVRLGWPRRLRFAVASERSRRPERCICLGYSAPTEVVLATTVLRGSASASALDRVSGQHAERQRMRRGDTHFARHAIAC